VSTNVYVDGFNLYYGCLRERPGKWLDLERLFAQLLPDHDVKRIRYFTGRVSHRSRCRGPPAHLSAGAQDAADSAGAPGAFHDQGVVSNDSDLSEPLRLVRHEPGKEIGLLNPHKTPSKRLATCGPGFVKQIRRGVIMSSQFPDRLTAPNGATISKPTRW
jgi:hypothetical protein